MVNFSFAPFYRLIDYGQGGILKMRAPFQMMRILHQAWVGNVKILHFWLNESGHRINSEMVCSICNKYEHENLFHILNVCPIYNAWREVYLRDSIENVENFWDILRPLSLQKLRRWYNFIGGALRLRSFIRNEWGRERECFIFCMWSLFYLFSILVLIFTNSIYAINNNNNNNNNH